MSNPNPKLSNLKPYTGTWRHGSTHTVRVPIVLGDTVVRFARSLDDGSFINDLTQVIDVLTELEATPRNNFSRDRKSRLQSATAKLIEIVDTYSLDTGE